MVDRALAVHRLRVAGYASAEVQRRLRISKSTVSVLGYLGGALAGMEPESVAELRTPAVTARDVWRLVTAARRAERAAERAARADTPGAGAAGVEDHEQTHRRAIVGLRFALRDHLTHARLTPARARRPVRRVTDRSAAARAVGWSHTAWVDDPVAFTAAHLAALAAAHGHVAERAGRAVALAGAEHALAGQVAAAGVASLHRLGGVRWRALADAAHSARTPAEDHALAALGVLTRKLREAQVEIARLTSPRSEHLSTAIGDPASSVANSSVGRPRPITLAATAAALTWEEVEADLVE